MLFIVIFVLFFVRYGGNNWLVLVVWLYFFLVGFLRLWYFFKRERLIVCMVLGINKKFMIKNLIE